MTSSLKDRLERSSPVPLFHQIAQAIRWAVSTGELAPGDELPSSREGSAEWGVNRHTVRRAYQELQSMGLVRAQKAGRMVVAAPSTTSCGGASPEAVSALVDRYLDDARDRFGLSVGEAAALVAARHHPDEHPGPSAVTVVECNRAQCLDLASQIEERWAVEASIRILDDDGPPPTGPVVATLYHFDEIRERWPGLLSDAHFVGLIPDPAVSRLVDHLAKTFESRTLTLVADRAGRNIAADLQPLLPSGSKLEMEDWEPERSDEVFDSLEGCLTLVSERVWSRLSPERQRSPHLIEVRYLIPPRDLDVVGRVFGWEQRS